VHPSGDPNPEPLPPGAVAVGIGSGIIGAIPARYASTRLPGKPLLPIAGRPMIEHVYRRVAAARGLERVVVLTDDLRIAEAVARFGGEVAMTPPECASGTDRIAHAAREWSARAVVNIQGDEPLIDPEEVSAVARHLAEHPADEIVTLAAPALPEELADPNAVKVVLDRAGYALYFSRSAIPYARQAGGAAPLKHLGIYGYQRQTLLKLAALPRTPLEISESLEQLRALENGIRIRVLPARRGSPGVDTREDLERVERLLAAQGHKRANKREHE
jgi:3-deoxy-manno-octulosonate cytidylyltransferase (CMP-KDO synthetase)